MKRKTTINQSKKYYCSQKFWWLSVYPERKVIASCCSATHQTIDLAWLKNNPGRLFNTPELQNERRQMLDGLPVKSCEDECWRAEDNGLVSKRLKTNSDVVIESDIEATPTTLNIVLGSDCNLTCVYCCKQYSTAWYRDIKANGVYFDNDPRFEINMVDQAVENLGQNKIKTSDFFQQILDECKKFTNLNKTLITGGEPFLYNGLPELINSLSGDIQIHTGLGVDNARLERMLTKITNKITLVVSAETTDKHYELVRFGNTYNRLQENLETICRLQVPYEFSAVLSNLTIFDFQNFQQRFSDKEIRIQFCADPDYLAVNIIDDISREKLLNSDFGKHTTDIHAALKVMPTVNQQKQFSHYIKTFLSRRNMTLDMYPEHFKYWVTQA